MVKVELALLRSPCAFIVGGSNGWERANGPREQVEDDRECTRAVSPPAELVRFELSPRLLVYGCRSRYAAELAEILARLDYTTIRYVDNMPDGPDIPGVSPVVLARDLEQPEPHIGVAIPVFAPGLRKRVVDECVAHGYTQFPAIVDPTAVVATSARLGMGTLVNAVGVVASNTSVGSFVSINRSTSIGHDNVIGDFVSFGPGCVTMGHVEVEPGAFIGGGATVLPGIRIGANAVVGAGSVVRSDVPAHTLAFGNPARVARRTAGYGEVGV